MMDETSEARLRDLRLNLAEICLEGRVERIAQLCRNPAGDALMTMINSGVRHLAMTKNDQAVAERCHRILSVEHDVGRKVCAYLALNLFTFPHTIDRSFDIVDVPTPLIATVVKTQLAVPMFFTRDGARRRALAHVEATVQEIHKAATVIDERDFREEILTGFMDGYSAMSIYAEDVPLKNLATKRAGLIRLYIDTFGLARDVVPQRHDHGIIRLGVLCPGAFSETAALRGHLKGIDRKAFQVTAFVPDEAEASVSAGFEDLADDFVALPVADIPRAAQIIVAQELDILMAGANLTNVCRFPWTLLMAQRLAPLQAVMHSSNITTGFATVDVYLNGVLNEPEDAQSDYTEELLLFSGSSNHYVLAGPKVTPTTITREQIGVPDSAVLAVSGANFFKIGPDLIDAWAKILAGAPAAHLMLYPFNPNWTTHYPHKDGFLRFVQERFAAHEVSVDRLHVLEAQPSRAPILGVLALADLYLDSFPYSGAVSLIDPLTVGCPPIVREGNTARCRQSSGLLRDLGLDVMVTRTTDHYITLATRLLKDDTLRREMREAVTDVMRQFGAPIDEGIGDVVGDALKAALKRKTAR